MRYSDYKSRFTIKDDVNRINRMHISCTVSHKQVYKCTVIQYGLCLEMVESVLLIVLKVLSQLN